jgi:M6 family metalloprotease-like protein
LSATTEADAEWRILALRVDFPRENPDELTTTGIGAFDLRSAVEAAEDYALPYDLPPHDRAYFERHLSALARYYEVVSAGRVAISAEVFPRAAQQAYTLPQSMLHYGNGRTTEEIGAKWIELVRAALDAAQADPDGPRLDEFNSFLVFHAGVGYETGGLNDIRSVFLAERDFADFNGGPLAVGGVEIEQAWILPESPSLNGRAGLNGLLAKFFGHQLGLPGLSNFADGLPALGGWSLMDVGANVSGYVRTDSLAWVVGFAPPHPMAWSKMQLGWIESVVVRRDTVLSLLATDRNGELPKAVRIPIDAREYFLLENRQQRGQRGVGEDEDENKVWIDPDQVTIEKGVWTAMEEYDAFVPGSGLLIWHVDEGVLARAADPNAANNQLHWKGIALEEADGYRDIGDPRRAWELQVDGWPDDPFFVGGQTLFGPATRPDSRSNREWETGVEIEVLSAPGDTMQVAIRFARARPDWPRDLPGDGRLQAADLDGDGIEELLFEAEGGVGYVTGDGVAAWQVPEARLLAAGDGDGDGRPEVFLRRDAEVSAWDVGADQPLWRLALDEVPLDARFSAGAEAELLLVGAEQIYAIDAISGELKEQRPPIDDSLPPAVGDLDGDGQAERIFATVGGQVEIGAQAVELGDSLAAPPVLGDLDGDGLLEVVLLTRGGAVHALRADELRQADFPAALPRFAEVGDLIFEPVLCDVDADGKQEIFVAGHSGIFGLDDDGRLLSGFPLLTAAPPTGSPVVVDLDGAGRLTLAALDSTAVYAWDLQRVAAQYTGGLAHWPQAGADAAGSRTALVAGRPVVKPEAALLSRVYCYPNPVGPNEEAHLRFALGVAGRIELEVFDALGGRVSQLRKEGLEAGEREITWSVQDYDSGLYLCRLIAHGDDGRRGEAVVKMAVSQ